MCNSCSEVMLEQLITKASLLYTLQQSMEIGEYAHVCVTKRGERERVGERQ